MSRRLNPEIFGPQGAVQEASESNYSVVASRKMQEELKETKKRVSHLESLVEVLQSQISSQGQTGERRTEAFSKALSELEQELREKNLNEGRFRETLQDHFRDQKVKDNQMENMVDRFNSNLIAFENKLSSLQKVIAEKEMTLVTYRRIIEQIVEEVEKLKRSRRQTSVDL